MIFDQESFKQELDQTFSQETVNISDAIEADRSILAQAVEV